MTDKLRLIAEVRDPHCAECKMAQGAERVCQSGDGDPDALVMVVSKMPDSEKWRDMIASELMRTGIDPMRVWYTSAVRCRSWDDDPSAADVKICRQYLHEEIKLVQPEYILVLGNEALLATTGHSGIMKWRGRVVEEKGLKVVPTLSLAAVHRSPRQRPSFESDLRLLANRIAEKTPKLPEMRLIIGNRIDKLQAIRALLKRSLAISYDIETIGRDEFDPAGAIVSLAGTLELEDGKVVTFAIPLHHPDSPWKEKWITVLRKMAPDLERVPKQIAHNGKFDARWLRHYGVNMRVTFDTMLAAHLLDENRLKGLKPQAQTRLEVEAWSIDTKTLFDQPLSRVLKYNALDTYYTYHIYLQLRREIADNPPLHRIFRHITMPANELLIGVERRGVWMDRERLSTNTKIAHDMRQHIDDQLMEYVPDVSFNEELTAMGGPTRYEEFGWPHSAKGKPVEVNFNPSNFARWFLFEHLGLPVLEVGKGGKPSMKEAVMLELKGKHPVIDLLLERAKWQKYCSSFLGAYEEMLDGADRIHTTFKLAGTVTGRLSSGKADAEKISGRKDLRGVNLQQVPRDNFIRGLFGAAPGYTFVEADFSQIELRIGAFLSQDPTLLHLYQTNQDVHRATAAWVLGVPSEQVTKDDRKKAKAVNFGFLYGMGANKFVSTAFEKYEMHVPVEEAQAIRRQFFDQFRGLQPWHNRQRRLVAKNRRVRSPLGRVRNLPDIDSPDQGVRAEAERQAINSPVQALASDMCMLSMIEIDRKFQANQLDAHVISTVHDALLFEIKDEDVAAALPLIKTTMENLPLCQKFGVEMNVPIVVDIKVGSHWGDARELTADEVFSWGSSTG